MTETAARLRAETQDDHQRLEDGLGILDRIARPDSRRRLVARFHGLHAGAERALRTHLATIDGLDFAERSRLPFLERDLKALGADAGGLPACRPSPPRDRAEALGLFYVLEGSTLGGHVIRKQLAARGLSDDGLSFLDPYGPGVGERWRSFLAVLERETDTASAREAAVRGARAGFATTLDWLVAPGVPA